MTYYTKTKEHKELEEENRVLRKLLSNREIELKKKEKIIVKLEQEISELKEKLISSNVPISLESNINYKELAEARLEIIEGLKFKISTLGKETDLNDNNDNKSKSIRPVEFCSDKQSELEINP